ncbi:MAG: metal-binding protein [Cyclobacteriaceae bacterium]
MQLVKKMIPHDEINNKTLHRKIRLSEITFGGNQKLKIYGRLSCKSGKRMKRENRVFFNTAKQAVKHGYRPCGHCLRMDHKRWKDGLI